MLSIGEPPFDHTQSHGVKVISSRQRISESEKSIGKLISNGHALSISVISSSDRLSASAVMLPFT